MGKGDARKPAEGAKKGRWAGNQKGSRSGCLNRSSRSRSRPMRCDCGGLAVTVLTVQVGSDPHYTVHLPLCSTCLAIEQECNPRG